MLNHLQNVGEEMADALHFFIELLIYINIDTQDIVQFLLKTTHPDVKVEDIDEPLQFIMDCGKLLIDFNIEDNIGAFENDLATKVKYRWVNLLLDDDANNPFYQLGRYYHREAEGLYKQILWDITLHLNVGRNFLKNKPWKQSEMMTQETKFQEMIVMAFIILMGYIKILGGDAELVYFLYFKKNQVNRFRIESKY